MSETLQPDLTVSDAREHEPTPVYRLEGVTRVYTGKGRSVTALDAVDLTIAAGEFATVQGPTGGGNQPSLAHVDLAERADHRPGELSGGQQQRVAIARALVKKPRVLLADEPTGNLDERTRDEILQLMEGLCAEGLTMVVVTHDSAVARRAHRRLRLERGVVQEQGS